MGKLEFEEMLDKHNILIAKDDSEKRHQEWLKAIDQFYAMIIPWLKPFEEKGQLRYEISEVFLVEDGVGTYTVGGMQLRFGNHAVSIRPVGKDIVGAHGRIDMEAARGTVKFFLEEKDVFKPEELVWKILLYS